MKLLLLLTCFAALSAVAQAAAKRPIEIADLFRFKRVADPQVSPDGRHVVYQVTTVDFDANQSSTALYIAATDGQTPPRQLTNPNGKKDMHPRWSPDGKSILFESTRSGTSQLYVLPISGGEAVQITKIKTGAGTAVWSTDGEKIAFMSTVYPEFSTLPFEEADAKNAAKDDEREKDSVKAKVFTKLFFRHWDSYVEDKRNHLFVCDADGKNIRNVTPGDRDAYPNSSTFSVGDDFTFTPDSKYLVFAAAPAENEAWSTNYDLCRVSITNTSTDWETLTTDNKAADNGPRFSPDGRKLAWRAQKKAGYEADKWELNVVDVNTDGTFKGEIKSITADRDESIDEFVFTGDANGVSMLYTTESNGAHKLATPQVVAVPGTSTGIYTLLGMNRPRGAITGLSAAADAVVYANAAMDAPNEVVAATARTSPTNISKANDALLNELNLSKPESVRVKVEDGEMQMWILKPPGFDESKKYPLVYMIHGGPQGAWNDGWSFRWNPQVWAAWGYVIALPNPRGSTGFGQKFVDQISGDWGGKCYRDLEAGLSHLEELPYIDKSRMASAGASFGGYMQDWFAVNPIAEKLKCQISHCSVWNFESMWGTTDELWFDEYEHGGLPWEVPGKYAEFSPHKKAENLSKYKVPMLVIHNDLDFRCPIGQGHELFTALQRQGVPSRMVNFPDEGHWVNKPKNSKRWHEECQAWLTKHCPPGGK